jgi:hypothetical protein
MWLSAAPTRREELPMSTEVRSTSNGLRIAGLLLALRAGRASALAV